MIVVLCHGSGTLFISGKKSVKIFHSFYIVFPINLLYTIRVIGRRRCLLLMEQCRAQRQCIGNQ